MTQSPSRVLTLGTPTAAQHALAALLADRLGLEVCEPDSGPPLEVEIRRLRPDLLIDWGGGTAEARAALDLAPSSTGAPPLLAVVEAENAVQALAAGATDVVRADATAAEMIARVEVLLALRRCCTDLERQRGTDPLTGALGRRTFLARAAEEVERARRYGHTLSLLLADIDGLKGINQTHGTTAGDAAVRTLASTCTTVLRDSDLLGRLGDDEMAVLLPSTTASGALALAERLRAALAAKPVEDNGTSFTMTVCLGAAEARDDSVEVLVGRAEKALSAAQRQGPNRLMVAIGAG